MVAGTREERGGVGGRQNGRKGQIPTEINSQGDSLRMGGMDRRKKCQ